MTDIPLNRAQWTIEIVESSSVANNRLMESFGQAQKNYFSKSIDTKELSKSYTVNRSIEMFQMI